MENKLQSLAENNTWRCAEKPTDPNDIKTKWVFRKKKEPANKIRFKAMLVAKGFTQKKGIDYEMKPIHQS